MFKFEGFFGSRKKEVKEIDQSKVYHSDMPSQEMENPDLSSNDNEADDLLASPSQGSFERGSMSEPEKSTKNITRMQETNGSPQSWKDHRDDQQKAA